MISCSWVKTASDSRILPDFWQTLPQWKPSSVTACRVDSSTLCLWFKPSVLFAIVWKESCIKSNRERLLILLGLESFWNFVAAVKMWSTCDLMGRFPSEANLRASILHCNTIMMPTWTFADCPRGCSILLAPFQSVFNACCARFVTSLLKWMLFVDLFVSWMHFRRQLAWSRASEKCDLFKSWSTMWNSVLPSWSRDGTSLRYFPLSYVVAVSRILVTET